MKRVFAIVLISIFLLISIYISAEIAIRTITGKPITGNPMQYFGLNITIIPSVLRLDLFFPIEGTTYFTNTSIPLIFYSEGISKIWYNLDFGDNITITSSTFFEAPEGNHTLYVYANNSISNVTMKSVNFTVNISVFRIIDDQWRGSKKGASTNFTILSYEQVQNLSNITLENINSGKILFNEAINMTDDSNFSDNQVDINSTINISNNRISLDAGLLPNFNKPATLWLYNLTFTNPRILKDGSVCSSSICTRQSYAGGILIFNVTGFSIYSADETPTGGGNEDNPGSPGGGGNPSGGGPTTGKAFIVSPSEVKAALTPGSLSTQKVTIKNNLNQSLNVSINVGKSIKDFLDIGETSILLKPLESREILMDIKVRDNVAPDLYAGKVTFSANGQDEDVLAVLEVVSEGALLDVKVEILKEYLKVTPGRQIMAEIKLFNVGEPGNRKDIKIDYILKDSEGRTITQEGETVSLETQTNWIKRLTIPRNVIKGKYLLYIKATTYEGKVASASASFEVVNPLGSAIYIILVSLIILIILILGRNIYFLLGKRKKRKERENKARFNSNSYTPMNRPQVSNR